jgi:signal peptidase I
LKRILAVAGDSVEVRDNLLSVNGAPQMNLSVVNIDNFTMGTLELKGNDFGPIVVPANSYFVMVAYRDKSYDIELWGPVEESNIHGRVIGIYWSWDAEGRTVRWGRIGKQFASGRTPLLGKFNP